MFSSRSTNALTTEKVTPSFFMGSSLGKPRRGFQFIDCKPQLSNFEEAVYAGLSAKPKSLEPKFFYDEKGSFLFDQICEQPEYYPTRTEMGILEKHAQAIHGVVGDNTSLIEFGSGSSRKIRLLLEHWQPTAYTAIEISREQLLDACEILAERYPDIPITAVCADYCQPLELNDDVPNTAKRVAFFPGSTIGNFTPSAAIGFLANVRRVVGKGGGLLIGVDLKKDKDRLEAAYNDAAGITAAFNLNLLERINRELTANFQVEHFRHHAFYNEALGRIEMHLLSRCDQQVKVGERTFAFKVGETIHTESSYKYTVAEFQALAAKAGYEAVEVWLDPAQLFSVHYLRAA
jgi:dimethylhistidine N-methyltransferase